MRVAGHSKKAIKIQEMVEIRWQSTNYIQF